MSTYGPPHRHQCAASRETGTDSDVLTRCSTGVISSTLVSVNTALSDRLLTTLDKSLITSSTALAALFASPVAGLCADSFGRKTVILAADVLFVCGALVQAWCSTVWLMIVGRALVGVGVGAASFVVPL